jgi:glycosyltransferase involved in cell wall biosynthesis
MNTWIAPNMTDQRTTVSVIIPAHNEDAYIRQCLESIILQDYPEDLIEIIVVDNNSTDSTADVTKSFPQIGYFFKKEGPVGAVRNFGVSHSKGEYLAFIDSDCVAPKNWLTTALQLLKTSSQLVIGGKCQTSSDASWIETDWILGVSEQKTEKLDLLGASIIMSRTSFQDVAGFDETVTSGEDTQLTHELRTKGYKVEINQSVNVVHLGNAKTARDFVRRQAWHSENYLQKLSKSLSDPTFILTIAFLLSFFISLTAALLGYYQLGGGALIVSASLPLIFTLKRWKRSGKNIFFLIRRIGTLYILDMLYVVGRVYGLALSTKKALPRSQKGPIK